MSVMKTTTTTTIPAPVYTVWNHPRYEGFTEVWTGEDFTKALTVALDQVGADPSVPLDHNNTVALRHAGKPVSAWLVTGADGDERIVFITK